MTAKKTSRRRKAAPPAADELPSQSFSAIAASLAKDPDEHERRRRAIYRATFSTAIGRECLADIIASGGLTAADPPLPRDTANHRAGARWFAGEIARLAGVGEGALARALVTDNFEEAFDVET
jgi:hypothetical protein